MIKHESCKSNKYHKWIMNAALIIVCTEVLSKAPSNWIKTARVYFSICLMSLYSDIANRKTFLISMLIAILHKFIKTILSYIPLNKPFQDF